MIKQSEPKTPATTNTPAKSLLATIGATFTAYILLVVCFALLALVYTYTAMPDKWLEPAIDILCAVALFVSGFVASRKVCVMGYLHGAIAGLWFTLIRILVSVAVFDGYVGSESIVKVILTSVVIAALGGIFGVNFGKTNKKRNNR